MHHVTKVLRRIASKAGILGAKAVKLANQGKWFELQELKVEPSDYDDSETLFWANQTVDLLRKCKLPSGVNTAMEAAKSFIQSEHECAVTNSIVLADFSSYEGDQRDAIHALVHEWRKEIGWVLGPIPDSVNFLFSSGATLNDRGQLTTILDKMSGRPTIYPHSRDVILPFWKQTSWFRALSEEQPNATDPQDQRSNRFFTVPKDGKTDRGCCVEASLNVSAQLGVGRVIRDRLRKLSIDLNNGQELHRSLARRGSLYGNLATIDLSRASDTISREVVRLVLPEDWHALLDALRARFTEIGGRTVRLEKFSSMGNGFTFELETLLFATLARALSRLHGRVPEGIHCYGDDIICPTWLAPDLTNYLRVFGFTPNARKTFTKGDFRESCGGDFFRGVPVRAAFLKEIPHEPQQWISLANSIRRVANANGAPPSRWEHARSVWLCVLDAIPSDIRRARGPTALGDLVIHDVETTWWYAKKGETTHVWGYAPVSTVLPLHHWRPLVQLAGCTLGIESRGVTPRGGVAGFKLKRVPLPSPCPKKLIGLV